MTNFEKLYSELLNDIGSAINDIQNCNNQLRMIGERAEKFSKINLKDSQDTTSEDD